MSGMKEINLHTLICLYEVIIKKFFDELVNIDYKELQQMLFEKEMKETAVYGCSLDHSKDNKIYVQDMINMTDNERRDHSREIANTYLNILKKIVENLTIDDIIKWITMAPRPKIWVFVRPYYYINLKSYKMDLSII